MGFLSRENERLRCEGDRIQAEYHKWRKARYSDEACAIVREGLADAERDKAAGMTREEGFRRFFEVYDRITAQLAEKQ